MQEAKEIYANEVSRLPSSERLRLAALILSELTRESEPPATTSRVALELLDGMAGGRLFKTAAEADRYLNVEKDSWTSC